MLIFRSYFAVTSMAGAERSAGASPNRATRATRATATQTTVITVQRAISPYTAQKLDDAIDHLDIAIAADDTMSIFGRRYWHDRVLQIGATPGILHAQTRRLRQLLDRLGGAL